MIENLRHLTQRHLSVKAFDAKAQAVCSRWKLTMATSTLEFQQVHAVNLVLISVCHFTSMDLELTSGLYYLVTRRSRSVGSYCRLKM